MPRAYWKGYLRLPLVTRPIELFPATSESEKAYFHEINTRTGHRLRQQMVDEETGRPMDSERKGRGHELGIGKYVDIDEDEPNAIQIESTHTLEIDGFVSIDKATSTRPTTLRRTVRPGRSYAGRGPRHARAHRHGAPRTQHYAGAARKGDSRNHAVLRL